MGVIDKFLNTIKLNDDYDGFDDDYLDEEEEDYEEEKAPRKRILNKRAEEEEDDDEYFEEQQTDSSETAREEKQSQPSRTAASRQKQQKNPKVSPIRSSSSNVRKQGGIMEVCLIKPRSMEESREITETLLENCIVILNMEGLDLDTAQRIIDFSSGSCFAIHGNLQKISDYSFLITPPGINISGDFQEMLDGTVDIPAFGTRF